jgi:SAM-dependent methyltransferase
VSATTAAHEHGHEHAPIPFAERQSAFLYDPVLWVGEKLGMARRRRELLAGATGRVLEIGAGTGLNVRHYPAGLDEVVLTEPMPAMAQKLERRLEGAAVPVSVILAGAEELPFEDDSFDTVVSTMVLCTVPDPAKAIAEIRRVLKPSGKLLFIEHLLSDNRSLARVQHALERPWAWWADGCRCNQPTLEILADNDLAPDVLKRGRWSGMPPIVAPLAVGSAGV